MQPFVDSPHPSKPAQSPHQQSCNADQTHPCSPGRSSNSAESSKRFNYCHDPVYRRDFGRILNRGESRNGLSRDTFLGGRGELRQRYQTGQENQLGALGLMVNIIVLWQTVYTQSALDHLADQGHHIGPTDVARLSPLAHPTINLKGRYRTTRRPPTNNLRPLRTTT